MVPWDIVPLTLSIIVYYALFPGIMDSTFAVDALAFKGLPYSSVLLMHNGCLCFDLNSLAISIPQCWYIQLRLLLLPAGW